VALPTLSEIFERVERLPDAPGCWIWPGAVTIGSKGAEPYPTMRRWVNGEQVTLFLHRYVLEQTQGPLAPGVNACHSCDVTLCIRPDHLYAGTQAKNVADRHAKGRDARGEGQWNAKLTRDEVLAIRDAATRGESREGLARRFGITRGHVNDLASRKSWAWLAPAVLALACLWPDLAAAEISLPCTHQEQALTGSLVKPGADRLAIFGARVSATCEGPLGLVAFGRADGTAIGDGGAAAAGATDIASFTSLEAYVGATRAIGFGAGPAVVFGFTVPLEGGEARLIESSPRSALIGGMARGSWGWAFAGGGFHEAAGDTDVPRAPVPPAPWKVSNLRVVTGAQVRVKDRTSVAVERVWGQYGFTRVYALVQLGGER
jgi:hypothetical protein